MTRNEIIAFAKAANFYGPCGAEMNRYSGTAEDLEHFVRLVIAAAFKRQPVKQEPVAYVGGHRNGWFYLNGRPKVKIGDALYAAPQQSVQD